MRATLRDEFRVTTSHPSAVVFVLSQLDTNYFRGLEGQYEYELDFSISSPGGSAVRAGKRHATRRSNNLILDLEPGTYIVQPHITARKLDVSRSVNSTILATSRTRPEKLLKVAESYDRAHAKVAGWRSINETVQEKKRRRLEGQSKSRILQEQSMPPGDDHLDSSGGRTHAPSTLRTDETLGYGDWDAVAALGLRVLVREGHASIELKRYSSRDPSGDSSELNNLDEQSNEQVSDGEKDEGYSPDLNTA